jgi:hypothetical protein
MKWAILLVAGVLVAGVAYAAPRLRQVRLICTQSRRCWANGTLVRTATFSSDPTASPPASVSSCNDPSLAGNPLLSDAEAAKAIKAAQKSVVENGPAGVANGRANNYAYVNARPGTRGIRLIGRRSMAITGIGAETP